MASVRNFLRTRRPDLYLAELDDAACRAAYEAGIAPIYFASMASLPLKQDAGVAPPGAGLQTASIASKRSAALWGGSALLVGLLVVALIVNSRSKRIESSRGVQSPKKSVASSPAHSIPLQPIAPAQGASNYAPPNETIPSASDDAATTPPTSNNGIPLPPEPSLKPLEHLQGKVKLADAHLSIENDGHGNEQAVGRVLIENTGDYAITDFRLSLTAGTGEWALLPFEVSVDYPMPIISRRIEPGGSLDVPVMTGGVYASYSAYGMKTINIEASVDGPPGTVFDKATVF